MEMEKVCQTQTWINKVLLSQYGLHSGRIDGAEKRRKYRGRKKIETFQI